MSILPWMSLGLVLFAACGADDTGGSGSPSSASGSGAAAASSSAAAGGGGGLGGAGAAGGGSPGGAIQCGGGECDLSHEVCCTKMGVGTCVEGSCPPDQIAASCDGPEDCPGGACCTLGSFATACMGGGSCGVGQLACHAAQDCPMDKPLCCQVFDDNYPTCTDAPGMMGCF